MDVIRRNHRPRQCCLALLLALVGLLAPLAGATAAPSIPSTPHTPVARPPGWLKPTNPDPEDYFGQSVAADGDTLVIGAPGEDSSTTGVNSPPNNLAQAAGAVYVFGLTGGTWMEQAYLKASNTDSIDQFGYSVAIDGDTIVVGAPGEDSYGFDPTNNTVESAGAVYVFIRDGATWTEQAYLKLPPGQNGRNFAFGKTVAVDGDTLVVGAPGAHDNLGVAYVFTRSTTQGVVTWRQTNGLVANPPARYTGFARSVAIAGDTIVVGEPDRTLHDRTPSVSGAGGVAVYRRNGSTWSLDVTLTAATPHDSARFGSAVAIDGDRLVVGAANATPHTPPMGVYTGQGLVYVFGRSSASWMQQAILTAANAENGDYFGDAVAVAGPTIVVGASRESSNGSSPTDNSAIAAGAVYVFTHRVHQGQPIWSQQRMVKAPQVDAGDLFGTAVAIAGDTLVAGLPYEDSASDDPTDTSAENAGAVVAVPVRFRGYFPQIMRP